MQTMEHLVTLNLQKIFASDSSNFV